MSSFLEALNRTVDHGINEVHKTLSDWTPIKLEQAVVDIRRQCGDSPIDFQRADWFNASLSRYLKTGCADLKNMDHLVLSYGLSQPHESLEDGCLLSKPEALAPAWLDWRRKCWLSDNTFIVLIWRGVLLSLFKAGADERGRAQARKFLADTWPLVRERKPVPPWLAALDQHQGLFGDRPAERYAAEWLQDIRTGTDELREIVELPSASWFWASLVTTVVGTACDTSNDARFNELLPKVLDLRSLHPLLSDEILGRVLDRYAACQTPTRHDRLLAEALDAWGSPQLNLASTQHLWSATSEAARRMICGWLAEEDLQDFNELCRREKQVDGRRLKYWLRFKNQITYSRLVLGDDMWLSRDVDMRTFRERKKGRLARLTPQPSPRNNAIILRIGDWWFLEFSETGNACYPYLEDCVKIEFGKARYGLDELKSKTAIRASGSTTLRHQIHDWEGDFDRFLADRGIRPDQAFNANQRRVAQPPHDQWIPAHIHAAASTAARSRNVEPLVLPPRINLPALALAELTALGAKLVDNRAKQGRLWIEVSDPPERIKTLVRTYGFHFVEPRGFYYK